MLSSVNRRPDGVHHRGWLTPVQLKLRQAVDWWTEPHKPHGRRATDSQRGRVSTIWACQLGRAPECLAVPAHEIWSRIGARNGCGSRLPLTRNQGGTTRARAGVGRSTRSAMGSDAKMPSVVQPFGLLQCASSRTMFPMTTSQPQPSPLGTRVGRGKWSR